MRKWMEIFMVAVVSVSPELTGPFYWADQNNIGALKFK